jgi:hypothetical protein
MLKVGFTFLGLLITSVYCSIQVVTTPRTYIGNSSVACNPNSMPKKQMALLHISVMFNMLVGNGME